jgi:hypothetical protein
MKRLLLIPILWFAGYGAGAQIGKIVYPAGTYSVTTEGPTKITTGDNWVHIEWEVEPVVPAPPNPTKPPEPTKPDPPVAPPPAPTPDVSLPVLKGQVWMLAVYDTAKAGNYPPGQQAILLPPDKGGSVSIGAALKSMQISWQPRDQADETLKTWIADAQAKGLPAVVVIGNAGKTSLVVPLPADEAGVLALARKIRGQN